MSATLVVNDTPVSPHLLRHYVELLANRVGQSRREYVNGRRFLVVPITSIVPGVLAGSQGPLYYAPKHIQNSVPLWDNVPIVRYHPLKAGKHVSAWDLEPHERIGFLRNSRYSGKLTHEGWFDEELTKNLDERIYNALTSGSPMEMSTGLYTENRPAENGANYGGKSYMHYAENYQPDHLAILPDQTGACSVMDGCGINVNEAVENVWSDLARQAALEARTSGGGSHAAEASRLADEESSKAYASGSQVDHTSAAMRHLEAVEAHRADAKSLDKTNKAAATVIRRAAHVHKRTASEHAKLMHSSGQTHNAWSDAAREASSHARRASTSARAVGKSEHHEKAAQAHEDAAWHHELEGNGLQAAHHREQAEFHEQRTRGMALTGNANPEGVNQYSHTAGAAVEAAKDAKHHTQFDDKVYKAASSKAHRASVTAQVKSDFAGDNRHGHEEAHAAHKQAWREHGSAAATHESAGHGHMESSKAHRKAQDIHKEAAEMHISKAATMNQEQSMSLLERFMSWFSVNSSVAVIGNTKGALGEKDKDAEAEWVGKEDGTDGRGKADVRPVEDSEIGTDISLDDDVLERPMLSETHGITGNTWSDAARKAAAATRHAHTEHAGLSGGDHATPKGAASSLHHSAGASSSAKMADKMHEYNSSSKAEQHHESAAYSHDKAADSLEGEGRSSQTRRVAGLHRKAAELHRAASAGIVTRNSDQSQGISNQGDGVYTDNTASFESLPREAQMAAFAHMHGGNEGSQAAAGASARAQKSGKKQHHEAAVTAHKKAAEYHKASGNDKTAALHTHAARFHAKEARRTNNQGEDMSRQQRIAALTANCACDKSKAALNTLSDEMLDMLVENKSKIKQLTVNSAGALTIVKNTPSSLGSGTDSIQTGGEEDTYSKTADTGDDEVGEGQVKGKKGPDAAASLASKGKPVGNMEPAWLKNAPQEDRDAWHQMKAFSRNKRTSLIQRLVGNISDDKQRKAVANTYGKLSTPELEQIVANQARQEMPTRVENSDEPEPVFLGNSSFDDYGSYQRESVVNGAVDVEGTWCPSLFETAAK